MKDLQNNVEMVRQTLKKLTRNALFLFFGLYFVLNGILYTLISLGCFGGLGVRQLWPASVIIAGFSLFPAGFYRLRHIRSIYLFPAIVLVVFGTVFLLFSTKIIKVSFMQAFALSWPYLLIVSGVVLIVVFFMQQKMPKDFPYLNDDSVTEDGEDN